jgi:hypothetical protein
MLTIRSGQESTFEEIAERGFVTRAIAHLRRHFSTQMRQGTTDEQLGAWARASTSRAEAFELRTERQIICFLDCEAMLGVRFYEQEAHGWAKVVLSSTKLSADDRARLLLATSSSIYQSRNPVRA